ncbi:MAG: hypothetical protein SWO11_18115 [Thermodesulfobacteriota bacterium]|nr:hypothetical protein [Thermodesulfobacteriota bacterium]
MSVDGSIEKVPVLVAIRVTEIRQKLDLVFQAGDKGSASPWREFFKDLKGRGLLEGSKISWELWTDCRVLRRYLRKGFQKPKMPGPCGPKCSGQGSCKVEKAVADDIRSIFYASSKQKAIEFFDLFKQRWQQDLPSAVKCLDNPIKACLDVSYLS